MTSIISYLNYANTYTSLEKANGDNLVDDIVRIKTLPPKSSHHASDEERYVGDYIKKKLHIEPKIYTEILKGAYVLIDDGGFTYHKWKKELKKIAHRLSSHDSCDTQFAVRGSVISELLFSIKEKWDPITGKLKKYSWFQLERHPLKFGYIIRHMAGWVRYRQSGLNQGPFGESIHTERHRPILTRLKSRTIRQIYSDRMYPTH